MKRVFIIHKWMGTPSSDWYRWLGSELEKRGMAVTVPAMPNTNDPKIGEWISCLRSEVGEPDNDTYLVGHSMGCQAILRYMEGLPTGIKIGGVLLVAGFTNVKPGAVAKGEELIIKPWIETGIDLHEAAAHSGKIVSIFSDNDPYVSLDDADKFKNELGSEVIIIPGAGHFTKADGYGELHVALNELLKMIS